jgi:hypothetical protein
MKIYDKILAIFSVAGAMVWLIFLVWQFRDMSSRELREGFIIIALSFIWLFCILLFFTRILLKKVADPEVTSINKEIILLKKRIEKAELTSKLNDLNKQ